MKVTVVPCGPAANESERKALEQIKHALESAERREEWVLLANLTFSVSRELQSDEVDLIAIGPPGVRVLEVKHWLPEWIEENKDRLEAEADRIAAKARRIGTTLRAKVPNLPRVDGAILLTQEPSKLKGLPDHPVRGVRLYTLNQSAEAVGLGARAALEPSQVRHLAQLLQPKTGVAIDGSLRRLAGYVNLELQTPAEERFHRVYRGAHPARQDRVILHLYDLSASDEKNAEAKARREFEALHRLQHYPWAPRILDSFQPAPGYPGEMFFFTIVDPAVPTLEQRAKDPQWSVKERLDFARATLQALAELHSAGTTREPLIHRNLTPRTILVKHNNRPVFIGFQHARIPSCASVSSSGASPSVCSSAVAPEVRAQGLGAADYRSDVYSACSSLMLLFEGREDEQSGQARATLSKGTAEEPSQRSSLEELQEEIGRVLGESVPPEAPPARYWTEDQVVRFRGRDYRIVARLGSGGVGAALKVVELDRAAGEELGTYVAKVVYDRDKGERILRAYNFVRSHSARHAGLSTVFEVARQWEENQFAALLSWVEGTPLSAYVGVFPLLAEDFQEASPQSLARRWLEEACQALGALHKAGLVHGDVSPRNLIVSGTHLVLTDYDFVTRVGETLTSPGTVWYCAPSVAEGRQAAFSDDIYALAASFFHVLFDREPFRHGTALAKDRGLNWEGVDAEAYGSLVEFFNKATDPDPSKRFASVDEALAALAAPETSPPSAEPESAPPAPTALQIGPPPPLGPEVPPARGAETMQQRVPWLLDVLRSFPGSHWGNCETRGLDTRFSAETYVPTPLEDTLEQDIRQRRVQLVVLCGNAGDGKTALLQHLARRLGLGEHPSANRVIEGKISGGPKVRINLDGSAAWKGRSADEILDEFLEPFQNGPAAADIVHLLAINDGRLLEWIEGIEQRRGQTALTQALDRLLQKGEATEHSFVRFISLNRRSLVGGIDGSKGGMDSAFLHHLLDQLYGGQRAGEIWRPCICCSARDRCEVFRAARIFGPEGLPELAPAPLRNHARQRLFEALQAVHLRGETHITMRELRAALVYILFGLHYCDDYHNRPEETPLPYWDRAFAADAPDRQGEVLRELAFLDPALEAHPQIDRYLMARPFADMPQAAAHYPELPLASARRRAYFEWTETDIQQVAGQTDALGLARGKHLKLFRDLPLMDDVQRAEVCKRLCAGIARLEQLPPQALDREGVVPLRITPRTPTETAFWVEKPLDKFRLEADLPPKTEGLNYLHRQAFLIYHYRDGKKERLALGAELFHLLLEVAEGYQLGDVASDDTFAHLSIFVQRLVREDDQQLLAWNPMQDETVYRVAAVPPGEQTVKKRRIVLSSV